MSNEPAQFDGKHWSVAGEGEGGYSNDESVLFLFLNAGRYGE